MQARSLVELVRGVQVELVRGVQVHSRAGAGFLTIAISFSNETSVQDKHGDQEHAEMELFRISPCLPATFRVLYSWMAPKHQQWESWL